MYDDEKIPNSIERWRIVATIQTLSPLHAGDGDRVKISSRNCARDSLEGTDPEYATVFKGHDGRPIVPATSVKGALRAWALAHQIDEKLVLQVFGDQERGGAVRFGDAHWKVTPIPKSKKYRFWCEGHATGLSPQVVIQPTTRTAQEGLLYYEEYVPEGTTFEFAMTAQNATAEQRELLIYILERAFQSVARPARLGSGGANGWGKIQLLRWDAWKFDAAQWLQAPAQPWRKALQPIGEEEKEQWKAAARSHGRPAEDRSVRLHLTLRFSGAMLVNDPTRRKKADADGQRGVSHSPVRKEDGRAYLPADSVRGAFRAQARRIWQTLVWDNPNQNASVTVRRNAVGKDAQKGLAGFYQLFGATGWRAPIEVEDFFLAGEESTLPQEFVAVDRFTGGVSGSKKFRAEALWRPSFEGHVTIRVDRLDAAAAGDWPWMLLAFTLRDWMEGDGSIGFGRSKNYGRFLASVEVNGPEPRREVLRGILGRDAAVLNGPGAAGWAASLDSLVREVA